MLVMSPGYAYQSAVGPVFDVATWSTRKVLTLALMGLTLGLGLAVCGIYFWNPQLFADHLPKVLKDLPAGILDLHRQYFWSKYAGAAGLGFFGFVFFAAGIACIVDLFTGNYYFRAGPGGLALCVPNGADLASFCLKSKVLMLELSWNEIADWNIVQVKQFGSLSRNAGNLGGHLELKTREGRKYRVSLDVFREPAFIIHNKIQDAVQMVPAFWGEPPAHVQEPVANESI